MRGEVMYRNNMVPFKMIKVGECFVLNQKVCMRISMKDMVVSHRFVYLDDGNVDSIDLNTKVVPMAGSYTMLEIDLKEEDGT